MQVNIRQTTKQWLDKMAADHGHETMELLMLANDLVPYLRFFCSRDKLIKILKLIKSFKFNFDYSYDKYHQGYYIYISKIKTRVSQLKINTNSNKKIGELLGFPDCCVKAHVKSKALNSGVPIVPTIEEILENTSNKDYILHLNFGYNFFYHSTLFHLMPHFPCSFDCKKTNIMINKFASFLKNNYFDIYNKVKNKLSEKFIVFVPKEYNKDFFNKHSDDLIIFEAKGNFLRQNDAYTRYAVDRNDYTWIPRVFDFTDTN